MNTGKPRSGVRPVKTVDDDKAMQHINKFLRKVSHLALFLTLGPLVRLFIRSISGREHIPRRGACIFVANQNTFIDAIFCLYAILTVRRELVKTMIRYEMPGDLSLFSRIVYRVIRWTYEAVVGSVPAGGEDPTGNAVSALKMGSALLIFPEGRHNYGASLLKGKTGAARISLASGIQIVPVGIKGSEKIFPPGKYLPRPRRAMISIGTAILPPANAGGGEHATTLLHGEIMTRISSLCGKPSEWDRN